MRHYFLWGIFLPFFVSTEEVSLPWGNVSIEQPLLKELVEHPVLQRLKNIDQSGPVTYLGLVPEFSRFEHSVGVLDLLQSKADAPLAECVAGLLHDVSHTAFSHLGDQLFYQAQAEHSYQDLVHLEFLQTFDIPSITRPWGIEIEALDPDSPQYRALEQPLPDLCADRIEYLIHTAHKLDLIDTQEARAIIDDLCFEEGRWFFKSVSRAEQFSEFSLRFTQDLYGSSWNITVYESFAEILRMAMTQELISADEIKYGDDDTLIAKIEKSLNPEIMRKLQSLKDNPLGSAQVTHNRHQAKLWITPKFRGVDPWVRLESGTFARLTEISPQYNQQYDSLKSWCLEGYGLIFDEPSEQAAL